MIGLLANAVSTATVAQGVASALTVLGTASSILSAHDAQSASEDYIVSKQAIATKESKRQRQEMLKQARIEQAEIANTAAQTGTTGSSGAIGAYSAIQSGIGANISFLDVTEQLSNQASASAKRQAKAASRARTASAVTRLGIKYGDFYTQ